MTYNATTDVLVVTNARGRIYFGKITTVSGGGTDSGGGGGCFTGHARLLTRRGPVPFIELMVGDEVQTLSGWRRVRKILTHYHNGPMCVMNSWLVTPEHHLYAPDSGPLGWLPAGSIFDSRVHFTGTVYNAEIEGETDNEHCYTLENGIVAHNGLGVFQERRPHSHRSPERECRDISREARFFSKPRTLG